MTKQVGRWTVAALTLLAVACAGGVGSQTQPEPSGEPEEQAATAPSSAASSPPAEGSARAGAHSEADDGEADDGPEGTIPHFADGQLQGLVTRAQARQRGLTLVELGDEWTPRIFDEDESLGASGRQPFRRRFIRLSNEDGRRGERDPSKNYLELFGIFPTLNVMRQRLADEERHACHEAVDDAPIEALEEALRPGADMPGQRRRANAIRWLRNRLERVAERRELESIDELADDRRWGRDLRRMRQLEERVAAIRSVQAHLRCEGFLHERASEDVLDAWTGRALRAWQSKHMIISLASRVDEATRQTLATDSEELDLLSLLRVLRERVVDATGVIEDGSASNQWGTVLGRQLQVDDEFRWVDRLEPLPGGAPDRVSEATEAAARALGWTDAESALAWLNEHAPERTESLLVALPLPEPPPYHSEHMELRAEIDRGDVWYSFPYTDDGRPRGYPVRRRPTLVLYARHEGRDVPLVRWNTTIGSWQPEINPQDGSVGLRYKESDVGPRVWRDVIASPAWLPPPGTPDDELLRRRYGGGWRVNTEITGPGYDSAYGLAMVIHHRVRGDGEDERDWVDNGIRSHGSVSYRSILRGYSHGCHRLFNHLAVRMTSFLLAHRHHQVRGRIPASLRRELHPEDSDETLVLELDTRGFAFELTPPVPIEVLEGRVRGRPSRAPMGFFPLPEELQAEAREQMEEEGPAGAGAAGQQAPASEGG